MRAVYTQTTKITNAAGRSRYITSADKQEEVVLHREVMLHSWEEHSLFEKENQKSDQENNEARELIVALPNELYNKPQLLESVCEDLAYNLVGSKNDFEYAVHWNKTRTNLHMHLLFSERENQLELEPKFYKKDIWQDKDTHKLAKANSPNAILVHCKGELQLDHNGCVKYKKALFKTKDVKFKSKEWAKFTVKTIVQNVFFKYGIDYRIQEPSTPFLSHKKLYKGASQDYLQEAGYWNSLVKEYNAGVDKFMDIIDPKEIRLLRKNIENNVKQAYQHYGKFVVLDKANEILKGMIDTFNNAEEGRNVSKRPKQKEWEPNL